jgi:uncharacterized membrane protein YcaP (DUF421 family)
MIQEIWASIQGALGVDVDVKELTLAQMALRALIIYMAGVALVRLGKKRFLGKNTAFDVLLAIMLGSLLARAINGSAPFFETLGAAFVLVSLHWLFAAGAFHSERFSRLIEGTARTIIRDGEMQEEVMRKSQITEQDLLEALRSNAHLTDPQEVQVAYLERSGDISIIPRKNES